MANIAAVVAVAFILSVVMLASLAGRYTYVVIRKLQTPSPDHDKRLSQIIAKAEFWIYTVIILFAATVAVMSTQCKF